MPRIGLEVSIDAENIAKVEAVGNDFRYFVKICCGACGEITDWVYLDQEDTVEVKGGRGLANMVLNCKLCGRESNISIEDGSRVAYDVEKGGFQQIVSFDCRGLEPVEWECRGGLVATTEKGKKFEVELEDGEWYDFDDDASESISVTNIQNQFKKLKGK
ncbi:unnamed protein product [Oikopleura dioica]|uniref:CXXC motif containing zinc binding protein n=1 Tax=Oikopleura dioica TaxID=34765 RepID=E4XTE2_OIKDI|nr:unnamed protein product [Oikopleura dioica]